MRLQNLAAALLRAEALRWRLALRRQGVRAVLFLLAAMLGLFCLIMLHIAAIGFLARLVAPGFAALIVAGGDAVLVGVCLLAALRGGPGGAEQEAAALAIRARAALTEEAGWLVVLAPLRRSFRGKEARAVIAAVLGLLRRR